MKTLESAVFASLLASALAQSDASIPNFVLEYAPLIYLDVNEQYYPSDIAAQITNTYPAINFTKIENASSNLSLSDLSSLNSLAGCDSFNDCNLYLTSKDFITPQPPSPTWLYGVLPNPDTGETEGATSAVVIVSDHGNSTVDAYYMYFYAFNLGIPIVANGTPYGDHVGDWEHNMIRFVNGEPVAVYYSIHSGGQAYTYDATLKNGSRPLGFSSKGGHATYPQDGLHSMYGGLANDTTSRGPIWDPVAGSGAWYYTFTPDSPSDNSNGTFTPIEVEGRTARGVGPTDWFYYLGKWGDKQYNTSYPGQQTIGSITQVFGDGPTGPLDKDLYRENACPGTASCSTMTSVAAASGTPLPQTVSRTYTSTSTSSGPTTTSGSGSYSGTGSGSGSSPTSPGLASTVVVHAHLGLGIFALWLGLVQVL